MAPIDINALVLTTIYIAVFLIAIFIAFIIKYKSNYLNKIIEIESKHNQSENEIEYLNKQKKDLLAVVKKSNEKLFESNLKLEKSNSKLKLALETAKEFIWEFFVIKGYLIFNDEFKLEVGKSLDFIEENIKIWSEYIHREDLSDLLEKFTHHVNYNTKAFQVEIRVLLNNRWRWMLCNGSVLEYSQTGKPKKVLGTLIDIQERKLTQLLLVKNEEVLKIAMEVSYQGSFDFDIETRKISFSNEAIRLINYAVEQSFIVDRFSINIVHPDFRAELENYSLNFFAGGYKNQKHYYKELLVKIEKEEYKWFSIKAKIVEYGPNGIPKKLTGVITNIDDRKRKESTVLETILQTEEQERARIASELHDSLGQKLTVLYMKLSKLKKDTAIFDDELHLLKDIIQESRNISHNLVPRGIEDYGFIDSLNTLINQLNHSECSFEFYTNVENIRLEQKLELNLYRITQEAINNAIKHSKATEVSIQFIKLPESFNLTIEDNGIGFDTLDEANFGFGIRSIKTRSKAISGSLLIESSNKIGTLISLLIPNEDLKVKNSSKTVKLE